MSLLTNKATLGLLAAAAIGAVVYNVRYFTLESEPSFPKLGPAAEASAVPDRGAPATVPVREGDAGTGAATAPVGAPAATAAAPVGGPAPAPSGPTSGAGVASAAEEPLRNPFEPARSDPVASAPPPAATARPPAPADPTASTGPVDAAKAALEPPKPPDMELQMVCESRGRRLAVVNGVTLAPGQWFGGAKVARIAGDRVLFKGEFGALVLAVGDRTVDGSVVARDAAPPKEKPKAK